jgi:uncharacterized BrkB/YihY/UPF0761 family membrane protein
MSDFNFYVSEGFYHIADWKGYDHILFVMALCLPFLFKDWKRVLLLITAFTIGHSVTLALSVFEKIIISSKWIEFLIPLTIVVTSLENLWGHSQTKLHNRWRYATALSFGLIHGLGFSNYLKSMLGQSESIVTPLLAFNIGLEVGQLLIVIVVLLFSFLFVRLMNIEREKWIYFVNGGIFSLALVMAFNRLPF